MYNWELKIFNNLANFYLITKYEGYSYSRKNFVCLLGMLLYGEPHFHFMKNFLIAFSIFLVWTFFGLWLYSIMDDAKASENLLANSNEAISADSGIDGSQSIENQKISTDSTAIDSMQKVETIANIKGLKALNQDGDVVFLFDEGVLITKNEGGIIIPNAIVDYKYKLNTYLLEHPDQELHIISYYDASENAVTPNYGEQRGVNVQKELLKLGIVAERMVIKPTIKKLDFDNDGHFGNGVSFVFRDLNTDRLEEPTISIPPNQVLYPKFVNNDIYANDQLKEALSQMESLMNAYPSLEVEITGHTDNVGNSQDNYLVGLKYAQQARYYFTSKGNIDKNRVKALSKGEEEPLVPNTSAKGRLENRRLEIKYILK